MIMSSCSSSSIITTKLQTTLNSYGLDIFIPFDINVYNNSNTIIESNLPKLEAYNNNFCNVAFLIGNTRSIWTPFVNYLKESPEYVLKQQHPLNEYIKQSIYTCLEQVLLNDDDDDDIEEADIDDLVNLRFDYDDKEDFIHFQQLANDIGFAYLNKNVYLNIHETYGPWLSFRAVLQFKTTSILTKTLETPPQKPPPLKDPIPEELNQELIQLMKPIMESYKNHPSSSKEATMSLLLKVRKLVGKFITSSSAKGEDYEYSSEQIEYHYYYKQKETLQKLL